MAGALGLSAGGCSFSYQLGSLFEKSDNTNKTASADVPLIAGSTKPTAMAAISPTLPPEQDLAYARAAASAVLARDDKSASQRWENPQTGARGTVTALASAYTQDGFTCRDFLASYVRGQSESWLQGEACRMHQGKWTVRRLKPWKQT